VRFVVTVLLWIVTTAALLVAVPAQWLQHNVVDIDGYAALAESAAHDPQLQDAMASELSTQVVQVADVDRDSVKPIAAAYTSSQWFPGQFAQVNRIGHRWLFSDAVSQSGDQLVVDLQPLLTDTSFQQTLEDNSIDVPTTVTVPVTATGGVRPGQLRPLATWGPWVSLGATVVAVIAALLMLVAARRRGKALAALGISVLLVGGAGWASAEVLRSYVSDGLKNTTGDVRRMADVMVATAEGSLHHWLNLTLAAGAGLVVLGVIVASLGSLRANEH